MFTGGTGRERVAVVGMGATGVMTTIHLINELLRRGMPEAVELHLIERDTRLGAGVAYGTTLPEHLLNMQAGTMSLVPERPDHFVDWLGGCRSAYVSRSDYSHYLSHCLEDKLAEAARSGVEVVRTRTEVADCEVDETHLELVADTALPRFDRVVLCLGDLTSTSYQGFRGHPSYVHSPWRAAGLSSISTGARVGVLGTSLTAIDVLLSLRAQGHQGEIVCLARQRGLPAVQPEVLQPHRLRHLTHDAVRAMTHDHRRKLSLREVAGLFARELDGLGAVDLATAHAHGATDALELLAEDVHRARTGQVRWYSALDATSELTPTLWRHLDDEAKAEFLDKHMSVWSRFRHPMPLVNAQRVAAIAETGRLAVLTGLRAIHATTSGGFDVQHGSASAPSVRTVDHLVNATGTGANPWLVDSPLLRSLLRRNHLSAHPFGGVDVDFDTMAARGPDGTCSNRLFFIGPLTRGVHFYTNSIETNLANSVRLSAHLADRIAEPAQLVAGGAR
ncbi:hypothetical protein KALB_4001 [Kutzneria albida DSM 43870]|uniref:FAD-dependent urate hydroxylase HpyO/Asp monooxygenase CreE-like FAD/NAD(P)-binding domain-containing protein n=2 Tax=Kutzneria TaxID=43356 RepID=W5W9D2_9PSEU|nr:hypothetical protein KALB_4001 [Kutzneria albida DSM 43870]